MGYSIRCKVKKRLRSAKRQRIEHMIIRPNEEKHYQSLCKVATGRSVSLAKPKNGFKYPEAKDAVFPQHELLKPIDYRSENLPMACYAHRGGRHKHFKGEEAVYMKELGATHPKMEILAGGGAVLATTGQKVSTFEAAIIATAVRNPEGAADAAAQAAEAAASPVAAAVAQDSAEAAAASPAVPEPEPVNTFDSSRRPLVTNTTRQKRAEENRPRNNKTSSKKPKPNASAPARGEAPVKKKGMKQDAKKPADSTAMTD